MATPDLKIIMSKLKLKIKELWGLRRGFEFKKGFTLIETIVALVVITFGIAGPITLVSSGLISARYAKNKLIAANLAQEGIELVQNIRENNIICESVGQGPPHLGWKTGYRGRDTLLPGNSQPIDPLHRTSPSGQSSVYTCSGSGGSITITNPSMSTVGISDCRTIPLRINGDGQYTYVGGGPITNFKRCINITQPSGPETTSFGSIPADDMLDVESIVYWTERGAEQSYFVRKRLYNWR